MPRPGSACSSYLVHTVGGRVVLDLGIGALSKLLLTLDYSHIDAIVISHMHADHFFDVVPLRYGLKYADEPLSHRLPLWLPPGGRKVLKAMSDLIQRADEPDFFDSVYDVREYDPAATLEICDLRLSFTKTRHYIDAFAIRAECDDAGTITYSADTAPCDAVVEHARGSALFLCEVGLGLDSEEGERGHTSASEAGEMARRAGVGRLVLTHYPASYEPGALIAAAKENFNGPVELAVDGAQFTLSPRATLSSAAKPRGGAVEGSA